VPEPSPELSDPARVVVIGDLEPTRRVCAQLRAEGHRVVHLLRPSDDQLADALADGEGVDAVAVVVRGDVVALRYALLTEHLLPRVRLVVSVFDRTIGEQLTRAIPNCVITSPAEVAVPSLIAGCLGDDVLTVDPYTRPVRIRRRTAEGSVVEDWQPPGLRAGTLVRRLAEQLRRNDESSRMMVLGMTGLALALLMDIALRMTVDDTGATDAIFAAAHSLATVGFVESGHRGPDWYRLAESAIVLSTIALTAIFTAGVVDRLLSARHTSIIGRRTVPVRDHVVVIGLGQVGLRLCVQLKAMGIRVLAVERDPGAANLRHTRALRIPVLIGNAADRRVIERMSLPRARALAAMGSDDLDNVEAIIAARAIAPSVRMVLRAGEGDVVKESQSLFRIAQVRDVSALTAVAVARSVLGLESGSVYQMENDIHALERGRTVAVPTCPACDC
jgi:Trk K+ transport system NAD-binding subunit